jgi:ADP-ribosyl-[dinitrogen reductase] hydrolase
LKEKIKGALLGVAIGDALGVPVEFKDRSYLKINPISEMIGYGTHYQKPGTWSDDAALTFCQVEAIIRNCNLFETGLIFLNWKYSAKWSARGNVFDIGITTNNAFEKLRKTRNPRMSGGDSEFDNGNGSLMRILPVTFLVKEYATNMRFQIVSDISSITHRHIRSRIGCYYFIEFCLKIINGVDKFVAYKKLQSEITHYLKYLNVSKDEISLFKNFLQKDIWKLKETDISSSSYVVSTLEAVIWSFMTTSNFKEAVLKAVNLGGDTDTIGSITGGIAGLYYGCSEIPNEWMEKLARLEDIIELSNELNTKIYGNK